MVIKLIVHLYHSLNKRIIMKAIKITNLVSTGLLSALLLMSAGMYFFQHDMMKELFESFGFPTYIIYPLAMAKICAVIVFWLPNATKIKEWAYSALFFELILAFFAHYMIGDDPMGAALAIVLLAVSYITYTKLQQA